MSPDKKPGEAGDWSRALREAAPYMGLGTSMALTLLLGLGAGHWLDGRLETEPIFFLLGGALGLVIAFFNFYKAVTSPRR